MALSPEHNKSVTLTGTPDGVVATGDVPSVPDRPRFTAVRSKSRQPLKMGGDPMSLNIKKKVNELTKTPLTFDPAINEKMIRQEKLARATMPVMVQHIGKLLGL